MMSITDIKEFLFSILFGLVVMFTVALVMGLIIPTQ